MIEIVVGVLKSKNKYLIAQRAKGSHQEFKWEFPGGKPETLENDEEALKREFKEELNINIEIKDFICQVIYDYPQMKVKAKSYYVEYDETQKLKKLVHEEIKWVKKEELLKNDMVGADIEIIKKILEK